MQTNAELQLAYDFIEFTRTNIFLTGKAGTGKTTFLHNLKKTSPKRMVVVAPTGVAAINAGGVTIHSLFQLPFGPIVPGVSRENDRKFNREKINLIKSLDLLVIDEISMVRADLLDGIDEVLRRYRNNQLPFGGVQLLMIGDLHQLSPVVKDNEWRLLEDYYETYYFFSSHALRKSAFECIELKQIFRQEDENFIELLNKVRHSQPDDETLEILNRRHKKDFIPDDEEGYITLTTHNSTAAEINSQRMAHIHRPSYFFEAEIKGDFPEYAYPTLVQLELKEGAQVMFIKNDTSRDKRFFNGKIGKITYIDNDEIRVLCAGERDEIVVEKLSWENIRYSLNETTKAVEEENAGSFTQYPLKLAWAITIHKSQGLTFEKAIIDASESFAFGQVYVALSRCKTLDGMVLSSPIKLRSIKTDTTIYSFTENVEKNQPNEEKLNLSKAGYQQELLEELFDFLPAKKRYFQLRKVCNENRASIPHSFLSSYEKIYDEAEAEIFTVSEKFRHQLSAFFLEDTLPEENEKLQERVKKASHYFLDKINKIIMPVAKSISADIDNKAVKKLVTDAAEKFRKEVYLKFAVLRSAEDGFSTLMYLHSKSNADIDYKEPEDKTNRKATHLPADITHPELYTQLREWRDAMASERDVPVYIILPTKTIIELQRLLPASLTELAKVKGIGKTKVKFFGDELIALITDYCRKNNIEKGEITFEEKNLSTDKPDTKSVTFNLFKEGKSLAEIAFIRKLTTGTIEGHIVHFIEAGMLPSTTLLPAEKFNQIKDYAEQHADNSFGQIKQAMGDEISYTQIRIALHIMGKKQSSTLA